MSEIYNKMEKHANGYLVWARPVADTDIWAKRSEITTEVDSEGRHVPGWYVNISRNGEQFGTYGPFPDKQSAMAKGMKEADKLPQEEPLP